MSPAASARWCPTPEQLMILEEMYRAGVRTPSATQIQQITAHLSLYGKIEGKNVFYWFQNHKARDRQKLRRKLTKQLQQQQLQQQQLHQQQYQHQLFQPHLSPNCSFCYSYFDHHQSLASTLAYRPMGYYNNPTTASPSTSISMSYPPQVGINSGGGSRLMDYNSWKREIIGGNHQHQKEEIDKSMMKMYKGGWMMVVDMDSPDHCAARPLKTLELFPTTSTNLRESSENTTAQLQQV